MIFNPPPGTKPNIVTTKAVQVEMVGLLQQLSLVASYANEVFEGIAREGNDVSER